MILAVIEELKMLCADELAEGYRPRAFYPVDTMLLIPYGQIDFRELERMAEKKCRIITIEKEYKMEKNITGFASVDRPWERFYADIPKTDIFLDTTPYWGLVNSNKNHLNEIAVEYFTRKMSFGDLIQNIDITARALAEYGAKKGDFITICSTTTPEVVSLFYAISKIGAIANVMSPFYSPDELVNRINECESKIIIVADIFLQKFTQVLSKGTVEHIIVINIASPVTLGSLSRAVISKKGISWRQFLRDGAYHENVFAESYEPQKPQAMVYSSGTTGASKGIVLSVDSFQKLVNAYNNSGFDTSRGQTMFQNIPPWHSTGLSLGINLPLSLGLKMCTDPRFNHRVFINNVLKYKPEYILTNTSTYQGFTLPSTERKLRGKSLSFLKYPFEGGEPLTEKDISGIEAVLTSHKSKAHLLSGYGECECGATVTTNIPGYRFAQGSAGIPLRDIITVGIFDDSFHELRYGLRGNVAVKTEIGMLGYFKNPSATEEFFYVDANGDKWSKTGDIGYISADGSLVVLGRKNDYSIISGDKIYHFDVENIAVKCSAVKLCEVQPHPQHKNKLVAHIVWESGVVQRLKRCQSILVDLCRDIQETIWTNAHNLNAIPTYFCTWDSFPSAHSGKRDVVFIRQRTEGLIEVIPLINTCTNETDKL